MEIVFHLGAHRTGSTTFQAYMLDNTEVLDAADIAFWGPKLMRKGVFDGLVPGGGFKALRRTRQKQARERIGLRVGRVRDAGTKVLLVSEENMIGSVRGCLRAGELYPAVRKRVAHYAEAFSGEVTRIALSIRAQDRFWASAIAYAVGRGAPIPAPSKLARIASSQRSWRDVISDLAAAVPSAEIRVLPYESHFANPIRFAEDAARLDVTLRGNHGWLNQAPDLPTLRALLQERGEDASRLPQGDGLWEPFAEEDVIAMREQYADDLFWLRQGAGGIARLTEEDTLRDRGQARRAGTRRGHDDDGSFRMDKTG